MNQKNKIRVCIGVPAYNEGQNIGKLLKALFNQKLHTVHISQILVIASGCTDDTVEQVMRMQKQYSDLELVIQDKRTGKASAINLFLVQAKEEICVIESADTIPKDTAIEELCAPFADDTVGMSGAHPIPTNKTDNFTGFCVRTMWQMHHLIALKTPKCGEMIAFRKVFKEIPVESPVDEASIEAEIKKKHLKIVYAQNAIVYNKGPETVREFIAQRRRINAGHIWLKRQHRHKISTGKNFSVILLTFKQFGFNLLHDIWLLGMIILEVWSRLLAYKDYYLNRKKYVIWDRIAGSKNPNID